MNVDESPVRSLAALRSRAAELPVRRVVVAMATGPETLRAVELAMSGGLAEPVLVGPPSEIRAGLVELGADPDRFEIVPADDTATAATESVRRVRDGDGDLLLKGAIPTSNLMRAVLDAEAGLRTDRLLSDVFIFDFRAEAGIRLVGITDGGVIPRPTLEQKEHILCNAVEAFQALGVGCPHVAVLAAVETVSDTFPSTGEAAELARRWNERGTPDCVVDGPLAVDLALSGRAAHLKGFESPVAGTADVLLFPDLESANMAAKSVEYAVPLEPAHCIVGAAVPVLIPSRSETAAARLSSIAFGALLAG